MTFSISSGRQHSSGLFTSRHTLRWAGQVPCPLPLPGSGPAQPLWGDSRLKPPSGLPRRQCCLSALEPAAVAAGKGGTKGRGEAGRGTRRKAQGESLKVALVQTQKVKLKPQPHHDQHYKATCKTWGRKERLYSGDSTWHSALCVFESKPHSNLFWGLLTAEEIKRKKIRANGDWHFVYQGQVSYKLP